MAAHETSLIFTAMTYLVAAVAAVPLARALGLGSIIGYLAAGIAIGPWGLRLVTDVKEILNFAEFGVVLMLFLIGLELEPKRLWQLRRPIFGWGTVQVAACAAALYGAGVMFGMDWRVALVTALGFSLSSTAIALQVMRERNILKTPSGEAGFAILLFQDVAAIPIMALIPLLGAHAVAESSRDFLLDSGRVIGTIVLLIVGGRLLLRPSLRWIARSGIPEIFTAAMLLLVVTSAALMQAVGLSMAMGAFLAGVLLAESEFKREIEADIEPFKSLFLGLFFIAVGMSINFRVVFTHPLTVAGLVLGLLVFKGVVMALLAWLMGIPRGERPVFVLLLTQGSEFAFVVFQDAVSQRVFRSSMGSMLIAAVALSMLIGPLLLVALDRYVLPRLKSSRPQQTPSSAADIDTPQGEAVIIAGFGRYGQIIGRLLSANGVRPTVLEHNADVIETLRSFGLPVFYGDATRPEMLRMAGADSAKVLVVAIADRQQSLKLVDMARENFPHLTLVARARNVSHYYELLDHGVHLVQRETFESSLMSGRSVLEVLGWTPYEARTRAMRFRRFNITLLDRLYPHHRDSKDYLSRFKAGRRQLQEQFAQERAEARKVKSHTWNDPE